MSRLSRRIVQHLPDWAWQLLQYRPVLTTHDRLCRRIDRLEVEAFQRGMRAERESIDGAADLAIERNRTVRELTARIEAGPLAIDADTLAIAQRISDRLTGRPAPARRHLQLVHGGAA